MSSLWRRPLTRRTGGERLVIPVLTFLVLMLAGLAQSSSAEEVGNTKKHIEPARKHARERRKTVSRKAEAPIVLKNLWTKEVLPLGPNDRPMQDLVSHFLRCHYTGQSTNIHPKLIDVVLRAARRFKVRLAEIVSGYRSPKYNSLLRKKGREVAADSQHPKGDAIDFRLIGVPTRKLMQFVRTLQLGGVGYYEESRFVHADLRGGRKGHLPFWTGQ